MKRLLLITTSIIAFAGCSQQNSPVSNNQNQITTSVLASLRPHASEEMIAKVKEEELKQQQKLAADAANAANAAQLNCAGNLNLPSVSQGSIAAVYTTTVQQPNLQANNQTTNDLNPAANNAKDKTSNQNSFWPFGGNNQSAEQPVLTYASYNSSSVPPPPPGASLVPPPPAVSLSTSVQMAPYGTSANAYPYPYMNPYTQPVHAMGSLFGSGGKVSNNSDYDDQYARERKLASFVPITPTGMDSRSSYKQRDDIRILWKGALSNSSLSKIIENDDKIAAQISKVEIGLPTESSKGCLSASPRQLDAIFKSAFLDKKIKAQVKQLQADLAQTYYRYLYSYNKYALAEQTCAARKQEVDMAGTLSEKQKAATDLAQAQSDADATKEDMKSAQLDLVSRVGIQSARTIIGRVSGITPSNSSLTIASDTSTQVDDVENKKHHLLGLGAVGSLFGNGHKEKDVKQADDDSQTNNQKTENKIANASKNKGNKKVKSIKATKSDDDLLPAPEVATKPNSAKTSSVTASSSGVLFELQNVDLSPRKSTLKVCIRNKGNADFIFDPDDVSLLEGNHKITGASVSAEFDSTLVQPDQEVTGTITIYGHPWNDRLTVALADGGKVIQLRK